MISSLTKMAYHIMTHHIPKKRRLDGLNQLLEWPVARLPNQVASEQARRRRARRCQNFDGDGFSNPKNLQKGIVFGSQNFLTSG